MTNLLIIAIMSLVLGTSALVIAITGHDTKDIVLGIIAIVMSIGLVILFYHMRKIYNKQNSK